MSDVDGDHLTLSRQLTSRQETSPFISEFRSQYLQVCLPNQSIANDIVDLVFERATSEVAQRYFDRLAVPYAVTWAARQMTDALFSAFNGPDTGTTLHTTWHADPIPSRVPMDASARGTLNVIKKPRAATPVVENTTLSGTTNALLGAKKLLKHRSTSIVSNKDTLLSHKGSVRHRLSAAGGSKSANSSCSTSPSRHSPTSADDLSHTASADTPVTELSLARTRSKSPAQSPPPEPLDVASKDEDTMTEEEAWIQHQLKERSVERDRAQRLEKQLEDVFREQQSSSGPTNQTKGGGTQPGGTSVEKPSTFVIDSISGQIVMVKPVEHNQSKKPLQSLMKYGLQDRVASSHGGTDSPHTAGQGASPEHNSPTPATSSKKTSPRMPRRKGATVTDFYREENGQQLVCKIGNPSLGVAVRDGEKEVRNRLPAEAFGEGRLTKNEFVKLRVSATERLHSSEGFREYFPNGHFTPKLLVMSPADVSVTTSAPSVDSLGLPVEWQQQHAIGSMTPIDITNDASGLGLSMHQQFKNLIAVSDGAGGGYHHQRHPGKPPHHLGITPQQTERKAGAAPPAAGSSTNRKQNAPMVSALPIRRPDLLPPLSATPGAENSTSRSSPPPSSSTAAGGGATPSDLQRSKDAPHFKGGKAGGLGNGVTVQRKEALEFITQQLEIAKMRRPTRVHSSYNNDEDADVSD